MVLFLNPGLNLSPLIIRIDKQRKFVMIFLQPLQPSLSFLLVRGTSKSRRFYPMRWKNVRIIEARKGQSVNFDLGCLFCIWPVYKQRSAPDCVNSFLSPKSLHRNTNTAQTPDATAHYYRLGKIAAEPVAAAPIFCLSCETSILHIISRFYVGVWVRLKDKFNYYDSHQGEKI